MQVFPVFLANTYLLNLYFNATKLVYNNLKIGGIPKTKSAVLVLYAHTYTWYTVNDSLPSHMFLLFPQAFHQNATGRESLVLYHHQGVVLAAGSAGFTPCR